MEPKVSVIIPVYNVEKYLSDCLNSICKQTLQDIEILCINDGSTDESLKILKMYAERDDRIKIFSQSNRGLSITRNVGISHASGKYIQFIDSDDMLDLNALLYCYEKMEKENLDIFAFDARAIFENPEMEKENPGYKTYYHRKNKYIDIVPGSHFFREQIKSGKFIMMACCQLIQREFLLHSKVKFIPGIVQEDNAFTVELLLHAQRVSHENKPFYIRRIRPDSIMTKQLGFINAYGYWRCAEALGKYFFDPVYNKETRIALEHFCCTLLNHTGRIYKSISEEEQQKIQQLPEKEKSLFLQTIWGWQEQQNLSAEKNNLQEQLAISLSKEKVLNQKGKDLSQDNKLLKADYQKLFKEYQQIKKRNLKIKKENKDLVQKIEQVQYDFEQMQHSVSFRVGRKLTYLPRKIRDWLR